MKTRVEYLDPVEDKMLTIIPHDFPDYTQINGVEAYDYYKVNRWFERHTKLRASRWGYCVGCIHFTPEILEQQCQYAPEPFEESTCFQSFDTSVREEDEP